MVTCVHPMPVCGVYPVSILQSKVQQYRSVQNKAPYNKVRLRFLNCKEAPRLGPECNTVHYLYSNC